MKDFPMTLAAGEPFHIPVAGNYIAILEASAPFSVKPNGRDHVAVKQGVGFPVPGGFERVDVVNGVTPQTLTVLISDAPVQVPIPSVVDVVDGGKRRSIEGLAFLGVVSTSAVVGQYAHHQLWNPDGSGKRAIVTNILITEYTANGDWGFGFNETALTTGNGVGTAKLAGGVDDDVIQCRSQNSATFQHTKFLTQLPMEAGKLNRPDLTEPIVIPPGKGFLCMASSVNTAGRVTFEYFLENA